VRCVAVCRGLVDQLLALKNAEAVLLVDRDKAEASEFHIVFNQRMRSHHQFRFTRTNAIERSLLVREFHSADQQLDLVAAGL